MKRISLWWLCLMMAMAGVTFLGGTTPVFARDRDRGRPDDRLDRLERRINEVVERQEQMINRPDHHPLAGPEAKRPPMLPPLPEAMRPPMPPAGPQCPLTAKCGLCAGLLLGLLLLVAGVYNILIAVWIFMDIRKRGEGHSIFIVLALLAGIPTAIIYALVRIGDKKP